MRAAIHVAKRAVGERKWGAGRSGGDRPRCATSYGWTVPAAPPLQQYRDVSLSSFAIVQRRVHILFCSSSETCPYPATRCSHTPLFLPTIHPFVHHASLHPAYTNSSLTAAATPCTAMHTPCTACARAPAPAATPSICTPRTAPSSLHELLIDFCMMKNAEPGSH
eukprot:358131-Chlamydomonas_euryale.AAC.2